MDIVLDWLRANSGKIILVVIVTVAAMIAARITSRVLNKVLRRSQIPNASIFINLSRILIWTLAVTIVLKPVFGVNPVTLFTALGIGGFAISLGLKDSIANTIGGFQLMFSHVLQPGDVVSISGVTGTVTDVTWRQTVVRERNGNTLMIPNSVLNTTALEKYLSTNESQVTIPFTAKPGVDMDKLTDELLGKIDESAHDLICESPKPLIRFTGFSPAGTTGNIIAYAKPGVALSAVTDAIARDVSASSMFTDLAASGSVAAKDAAAR
ncbi:mechanosensitive ion channel family protein [Bifidobacterium castoris]|uniref:Transporter n=1 Tax=Bifidobacterium castoris TaxID=2306972 RepID=A0A430F949_9BIFI|nr:mechanosensitive ion channel domain-containing protein [Bifidobacterium castoris]RSX49351.1 transporter [Bifidobacterium castoris]